MIRYEDSQWVRVVRKGARAAGVLALAAAATTALGQVRQVQQGHALDVNPQTGSGGSNAPVAGYVPINPNDVITGNVAGLSYFHGRVGTSSPDVFQAPLGSAALQNFARQSAGGIPTSPGSYNRAFFLPSTVVSTAQGSIYSAPLGNGFSSNGVLPSTVISPTVAPYPSAGVGSFSQGILLRNFGANPSQEITPGTPGGEISSPLWVLQTQAAPAVEAKPVNGAETQPAPGTTAPPANINEQINNTPDPRTLAVTSANENVASAAKPQNIGDQTKLSAAFLTMEAELAKAQAEANAGNPNGSASTVSPEKTGTASTNGNTGSGNVANSRTGTRASLAKATIGGVTYQTTDPTKGNYLTRSQLLDKMNALDNQPAATLKAGQKIAPVKSLVETREGQETTSFDKYMKNGEELLKQGQYLDAADAYQSALVIQPDNPLAAIGRAHSELGAGMFESAAYDLKFVYTKKPEMIAVRYDLNTFLPPKRLNILFTDLAHLTEAKNTGNTASFLYCYLAYNTGRTNELQQELDRWSTRGWKDSWQAVVAKAWMK